MSQGKLDFFHSAKSYCIDTNNEKEALVQLVDTFRRLHPEVGTYQVRLYDGSTVKIKFNNGSPPKKRKS